MARDAGSNFVDECAICVQGGNGGAGCVAFRREANVAKGGPDGGDGGDGGDVWLVADHNMASLLAFRDHPHRRAGHGKHGMGKSRHGARGKDCEVHVPVGTTVKSQDGELLCDLTASGQRWLAAHGGDGGRGNAKFLSNRRRSPAFAEQAELGEERWLKLELKLLADVALVGFPNVGKSTLISRVSAAKPKIANYPFTTLEPNLGVVRGRGGDGSDWIIADVPGLIEGASQGVGLGVRFLRHIERARVLVILLDPMPLDATPPQRQLEVLLGEIAAYSPEMLERRRLVTVSKADLLGPAGADGLELDLDLRQTDGLGELGAPCAPDAVFSAVTGQGIDELVLQIETQVREARAEAENESLQSADQFVTHRPLGDPVTAIREGQGWRILGRPAERAVALSDLTQPGAMDFALERLDRLGIETILRRVGVRDGETIYVGQLEFEYFDDELSVAS